MKSALLFFVVLSFAVFANAQPPASVFQAVCGLRQVVVSLDDTGLPWRQVACLAGIPACNSDTRACDRFNDIANASRNMTISSLMHLHSECHSSDMNQKCCRFWLGGKFDDLNRAMDAYGAALQAGRVTNRSYESQSLSSLCP